MTGIYKIENLINHQVYIGQSKTIEKRWQDHKNRAKNGTSKFYNALREYGIENFSWEVIEECPQEKLDEAEIYWIEYYDSFKNGYNSTSGGQFQTAISSQAIFDAWDRGLSIKEIANELHIGVSTVYYELVFYENYSAHESKVRGGRLAFKTRQENNGLEENSNILFQYSLQGDFIREWSSCKEVERELKISSVSIGKVLNGLRNSAGGFRWSREKKEKLEGPIKTSIPVKVQKYSLDNVLLEEYESYASAARSVNKNDTALIRRVVNTEKTAYGYKWKINNGNN